MKKNKKGQLSLVVKLIFIALIITVAVSTIFNKNFYYDALDFIENLFQPPEVDPLPSTTQTLIARERGLAYLASWVEAFERMSNSDKKYCYELIPATTRESREHNLAIRFSSSEENSFRISLSGEGGAALSKPIQINSPFCLIAQPRSSESEEAGEILENFREAFYSGDEEKRDFCIDNPEQCALIFSKPETLSDDYTNYQNFQVNFLINAPDRADRRNSFYLRYFLYDASSLEIDEETLAQDVIPEQGSEIVFDASSGRLTDGGFLLFKIGNNLCIMPLASTTRSCETLIGSNDRNAGDISLLRRSCFFESSSNNFKPNQKLLEIPRCGATQEEITELLKEDIMITFALIRSGPAPNVFYPKIINYNESEGWTVRSALEDTSINFPSSSQTSPNIINNIEELLKDKNLEKGRKTLCETYIEQEEVTMQGETTGGSSFQTTYTITKIEGLKCELLENINN